MTRYWGLNHLVTDAMGYMPEYKSSFVPTFLRPHVLDPSIDDMEHSGKMLITKKIDKSVWAEFEKKDTDYYKLIMAFKEDILDPKFKDRVINNKLYNMVLSLAVMMPELMDFLKKSNSQVQESFSASRKFLTYATSADVSPDYNIALSVILLTESEQFAYMALKSDSDRTKKGLEINALTDLYHWAFGMLLPLYKLRQDAVMMPTTQPKPTDCYIYKGKPYGLKYFSGNGSSGKKFIFYADSQCGKTFAMMRIISAAIAAGFTVIMFGIDLRKEWRLASLPLKQQANDTLYRYLIKKNIQGEKPAGLPIKIYCDDPKYACEEDIKNWPNTVKSWNDAKGVLFFESNIINVIKSLTKWRGDYAKKKIMGCFNELQEIAQSMAKKGMTRMYDAVGDSFTHWSGSAIPTIVNTHYNTKIHKKTRSYDEMFLSYISTKDSRDLIAKEIERKEFGRYMSQPWLKKKHIFLRYCDGHMQQVRFLVPPCMPKNPKYSPHSALKPYEATA